MKTEEIICRIFNWLMFNSPGSSKIILIDEKLINEAINTIIINRNSFVDSDLCL